MNSDDKKEVLRMLHNRITETNFRIQTTTGAANVAARRDKANLEDMYARIEDESGGSKQQNYVNFAVPAERVPVLQNTVNNAMVELAKKPDLESKRTMQKMLQLQIILMGGKE